MTLHQRAGSRWIVLLTCLTFALVSPHGVQAAANRIYSQSASGTAQSNAFTAQADDPSAIYYNPAVMTQLRRVQFSFGGLFIGGSSSFRNASGQTAKSSFDGSVAYPPPLNFYVTANLGDIGLKPLSDVTVGLGVLSPFGTLMRWPDTAPFSSARTFAAMELADIKPTVAYRLNDQLSFGLGADIYTFLPFWGEGHLERALVNGPQRVEVTASGTAAGFNASLMYTPFRNSDGKPLANIGLVYRSQATMHTKGQQLVNGQVVADTRQTLVLPQIITAGIALWPIRNKEHEWKLELDVDYTGWKAVRHLDLQTVGGGTTPNPLNWRSTHTIMVGTEYKWLNPMVLPDWEIALRGGYWHSQTPIPDSTFNPEIPDSDNHSLTIGTGFLCKGNGHFLGLFQCGRGTGSKWRPDAIALDTAFQVLLYENRTVTGNLNSTVNGLYSTTFYIGSVNLRVNF